MASTQTPSYSDELFDKSVSVLNSAQAIALSSVQTGFQAAERVMHETKSLVSGLLDGVTKQSA